MPYEAESASRDLEYLWHPRGQLLSGAHPLPQGT